MLFYAERRIPSLGAVKHVQIYSSMQTAQPVKHQWRMNLTELFPLHTLSWEIQLNLLQGCGVSHHSSRPPCRACDWTLPGACEVQEAWSAKVQKPPRGLQTRRAQVNENIKQLPVEPRWIESSQDDQGPLRTALKKWSKQTTIWHSSKHKQHICRGHIRSAQHSIFFMLSHKMEIYLMKLFPT